MEKEIEHRLNLLELGICSLSLTEDRKEGHSTPAAPAAAFIRTEASRRRYLRNLSALLETRIGTDFWG